MRAGLLKTVIIVGFILLTGWILHPTYQWYYVFTEEQKAMTSIPKKEINEITEAIETNVGGIRNIVKNSESFTKLTYKGAFGNNLPNTHPIKMGIRIINTESDIESLPREFSSISKITPTPTNTIYNV